MAERHGFRGITQTGRNLFYLIHGDKAEFNLPQRMTPELMAQLDKYEDVHAYLKERKEVGHKKQDAHFRTGSSKYRGVSWDKHKAAWRTQARVPQPGGQTKRVRLSGFVDEDEAARAYDRAVIPLHGRTAMLNFPLASYIEAGEFSEEQLDAIDARIAAGKAVPASSLPSSKLKAKQAPPRQRRAAGATANAAHVGEVGRSGSGITAAAAAAPAAAAEEEEEQQQEDAGFVRIDGRRIAIPSFYTQSGHDIFADPDADITEEELAELRREKEELQQRERWKADRRRERDQARERLEQSLGIPDEEQARWVLEAAEDECCSLDELIPGDTWFMAAMVREDDEEWARVMQEARRKYPLGARVFDDSELWHQDGTPNLYRMFCKVEEMEAELPELKEGRDPDTRDWLSLSLLDIRQLFMDRGIDYDTPASDEELGRLLRLFAYALPAHILVGDPDEGEEEEEGEEAFSEDEQADEEEEGSDTEGCLAPPPALFPASLDLDDARNLLVSIAGAAHGMQPPAGSAAPAADVEAAAGIASALSVLTLSGTGKGTSALASNDAGSSHSEVTGAAGTAGPAAGEVQPAAAAAIDASLAALQQAMADAGEGAADSPAVAAAAAAVAAAAAAAVDKSGASLRAEDYRHLLQAHQEAAMAAAAATSRPASPQGQEQGAAEGDEDANLAQRTAELTVRSQELTASVNRRAWEVEQRMRERNFDVLCTYAEGLVYAHFVNGKTEWLEEALGPAWRERLAAAAQPGGPKLFGTHGGAATWPPDFASLGQILAEMTGVVPTRILSGGLAEQLEAELQGGQGLPCLDDFTLANWYAAVKEQVAAGAPITGLLPAETFSQVATKAEWPRVGPSQLRKIQDKCFAAARRSAFVDWGPGLGPNCPAGASATGTESLQH
ncbi:hypothetical protein ABPG77_006874 [Micractinium sp. CCAP 211/92]